MRILILGGDGYLGWPTAMRFSSRGHDVHVVDNYLRRRAHQEAGTDSLTPIATDLPSRVAAWHEVTGRAIGVTEGDLVDWETVEAVFRDFQPEAVVHYGEMPSAPYSMKDRHHAVFTQTNNVVGTLNVLWAIRDLAPDCHLVKLGTMGEYGTPNIDIEEGFLEIVHNGRDRLPAVPEAARLDVPPVEGARQPQHPLRMPRLGPARHRPQPGRRLRHPDRRDAAGRPAAHAVRLRRRLRHRAQPLLPAGGRSAIRSPCTARVGRRGATSTSSTRSGASSWPSSTPPRPASSACSTSSPSRSRSWSSPSSCRRRAPRSGWTSSIGSVDNPRVELEEHYYNPTHTKLLDLGLRPHLLSAELVESMFSVIERVQGPRDPRPHHAARPVAATGVSTS